MVSLLKYSLQFCKICWVADKDKIVLVKPFENRFIMVNRRNSCGTQVDVTPIIMIIVLNNNNNTVRVPSSTKLIGMKSNHWYKYRAGQAIKTKRMPRFEKKSPPTDPF